MRYSVDLRPGRTKPISAPRTNPSLIVDCNAFAEKWDALVNGGRLTQSALVTYDESVVGFNAGKWEAQRWMLPSEPNHTVWGMGLRIGSLINFVSAAGEHLLAVWVLKNFSKKKKNGRSKKVDCSGPRDTLGRCSGA